MDEISGPNLEVAVAVAAKRMQTQKAVSSAMAKLIDSCGPTGQENLPADATFHTYA
jgi:hypothetical protein